VNPIFPSFVFISAAGLVCAASLCQQPLNAPDPGLKRLPELAGPVAVDRGRTGLKADLPGKQAGAAGRPRPQFLTAASPQYLWPRVGGVATVYYVNANANSMNAAEMAANANIAAAIGTSNADFSGLLQWVPWTSVEADGPNYVEINLNQYDSTGECEANEGYEAAPAQPMGGSVTCAVGTILHEMGHVIGLYHEFERPDRNNYVTVNYNNAIKGSWGNFEILTQDVETLGLYDYASLMQYPSYSFSRNGGPVIETIPAGMPLGSFEGLPAQASADYSAGDKEAIDRLYGAPPTQVTVTSNPVGLQVEVDGEAVTTPQIYAWPLNSTHTLAVASGVQTLSGDIENSSTLANFYYTYGRWNDSTAESHTITVLPGDGGAGFPATSPQVATYSANFIQLVPYTAPQISPGGSGSATISPAAKTYTNTSGQYLVARQLATLTAAPNSGWSFYEFNNGPYWLPGGLSANPKVFYVPDTGNPVDPTAEFTNTPVFTVNTTPNTFSSNLYADVDGEFFYTPKNFSSSWDSTWTAGSSHTLSLYSPEYPYSSNSRYAFSQWNANGVAQTPANTTLSIPSLPATSTSYVAAMTPQFAPATNFSYPPCGGTATLTPASPTGDGFYPKGTVLTYTATPTPGYSWEFAGWSFDLTGTSTPATLTANDETLVNANFNIVNSPLTLTGISPASALIGGPAFTLTLTGTGFSPDSIVGAIVGAGSPTYPTVTYVSANELTVQIPATDIASAGALQVYVENFPTNQSWTGCANFGYQTLTVHGANLATTTALSSSAASIGVGKSVTFTASVASAESNATGLVTFKDGTTTLGSAAVNSAGVATYATASLPAGLNSITAAYGGDSSNSASTSAALTETIMGPASITAPTAGSTLTSSSVTFTWTPISGATGYSLWLGSTGAGSYNLYSSGARTTTSVAVGGLPINGETIYARLYTIYNGTAVSSDSAYTAETVAGLTTPAPGSVLAGPSVAFSWSPTSGAVGYSLWLGSTGVGSNNLYNSHSTTATTVTAKGLPTNGETIYAQLNIIFAATSAHSAVTFTAASLASLASPAPGSTLTGTSATFSWTAATGSPAGYYLYLGSTGVGSSNLYKSTEQTGTSVAVSGLPANGETIYARLYTSFNGTLEAADFTCTAVNLAPAVLSAPSPGGVLPGPSATFSWTGVNGATGYSIWLGSTGVGSSNLYKGGTITGTSAAVGNLPVNGEPLYVRLNTNFGSQVESNDYTFTAVTSGVLTTPAPGGTLAGSAVTFSWTPATGAATGYSLWIGSTGVGSYNLYNSHSTTATSVTVTGLPTNGETIYVQLHTLYGSVAETSNYTYTAAP